MKNILENWKVYMTRIESPTQTDTKRRSELQGFLHRWKQAKYVIHIVIYLGVLAPVRLLSLSFQQNQRDPIKAVERAKDFMVDNSKINLIV